MTDTEDASEPDTVRMEEEEAKSSSFEEKLAALHAQLKQVEDGKDPTH
jgi:hypothetical protein